MWSKIGDQLIMRKLLFFVLMIAVAVKLQAQADSTLISTGNSFEPSISLGVLYGMSWDGVNFSPVIAQDIYNGNRIAAVLRYLSDPHLGIQLELSYDQRGWVELAADSNSANYVREASYLEFGAYSHITITKGAFKPMILMGPYFGFPLSDSETIPSDWDTSSRSYYTQALPSRLQYGLAGGIGFEWAFGKVSLQIDGRYRYSLGNIFPSGTDGLTFSQNRGYLANATLLFRIR